MQPARAHLTANTLNGAYQQRWGSSLTPLALTAAMRNADQGYMSPLADLLDEVRETDPHLHAVLGKREWTVAGAEWEVRPSTRYDGAQEPPEAEEARIFVANILRALPNFSDRLSDLLGAIYYGRAAAEVVWRSDRGMVIPEAIFPVHPRMIHYDAQWRMRLWCDPIPGQEAPFGMWPGVALDESVPGRFIVHAPRIRGGFATREGIGRPLAWFSLFKRWVVRDAMGLAEMGGRMARVGKYATGNGDMGTGNRASEEDKSLLETALEDWSASTALIHPDTTDVKLVPPVSGRTLHHPMLEMFNMEMSKAVLGETLTTEAGSKGARALGEVHAQQGKMIARYDASALAETLRRHLIAPIVLHNFGPDVAVPRIVFAVDPQESLDSQAQRLSLLIRAGLRVSQTWVRNEFGIADPGPDEELMGATFGRKLESVADGPLMPLVDGPL